MRGEGGGDMRGNAETTAQDYIKRRGRTKSSADNNGRFASGSAQTPVAAASSWQTLLYAACFSQAAILRRCHSSSHKIFALQIFCVSLIWRAFYIVGVRLSPTKAVGLSQSV